MMTIVELSHLLASRKVTSRELVEQSLAAIGDPEGEGARTFLLVHRSEALAAADRIDALPRGGGKLPALAGIPNSNKDLFGEAGLATRATLCYGSARSSAVGYGSLAAPTVPEPPRVPVPLTVVRLLVEMLPFTMSLPALTLVAPV